MCLLAVSSLYKKRPNVLTTINYVQSVVSQKPNVHQKPCACKTKPFIMAVTLCTKRLLMCGSRKYPYPPPPPWKTLCSLICTPLTPRDFLFQGVLDDPSSRQEFTEFLNGTSLTTLWKFKVVWVLKNKESEY